MFDKTIKELQTVLDKLTANHKRLEEKVSADQIKIDDLQGRYADVVESLLYCAVHLTYYRLTHDDNKDVQNALNIMSNWVYDNYNEIEC